MKKLILFLFLVSLNTFGQYATKHYIAPAPWNYSSSANEFIVSTVTSGTVSVAVTKSDGTAITTMSVTSGTPAVYRPSNATNPVSAFAANAINTVYNDRGLIFTSASPIAVSIRNVESDSYSAGIPSFMKGNAALASYGNEGSGTSFRVGYYRSVFTGLVAQGTGAIAAPVYSVMAINNNTVVSKNGTALVTLQAGQSYLFQTPIGDLITSTKPVVMNSGSWQDAPGGCGDGVFDQIPPNRVLGKNYFVVRGSGTAGTGTNLPEQTLFIATENNTTVTATTYNVAGTATGTTTYTLATAGSYQNIFHGDASTAYTATSLSSNKNIVVYSGTAQSCEVDMSALPPISACAGSFKVETKRFLAFDNTTVLPYFGYVLINSPTAIVNINGANLETLGGIRRQLGNTGYYLIDFTNTQLGDPTNLVFTSTVRMSVSMVQQGGGYSMSAYLSSFNDTLTPVDSTINGAGCITLLTAEPGFSPYQWYYNGALIPGATSQTYRPTGTGNYSVSGTRTCGLTVASTDFVVNCVPIDAIDDGTAILPFATVVAGTSLSTSVKANDLLDSASVSNLNTTVTPSTQGPLTIDSLGIITVASGTPSGVYAIQYQLCSTLLFPTVCDLATAYVKVAVLPGSIAASQSICSGGNPAEFTSVSPGVGGSPITSYRWESSVSPFTTWNTIAGANTATYDAPAGLTVTTQYRRIAITSLGESDPTTSVTVTIQAPTLSGVVVNTTCGSSNGTITITSNATSFLWSDGVTTKNRTALPAGNYSVTATDASSCTATASFVVNSSGVPRITGTVSNVNCFGQNTGAIATVMVITGTRTYTYAWTGPSSFTATTASISSLAAGTYNLTVTDNNGCKGFYSANVTQPIAALSASSTKNDVSCLGGADGAVNLIVSGGNGPYSYEWTGPNSFTATSQDLSSIAAGPYNVTVTDAKGCTTTATAIVGTPAALTATLSSNSPVCSGSDAVFTITGTIGNTVTYTGASSGIATIGGGGTATVTITGVTTSTTLNITNVSNGTCNQALAATATVSINPLPAVPTVVVTAPTCATAATNILSTYSASLTYTSTPAGLTVGAGGVIIGGTNGTSYTITATNASLCVATTASFIYNGGAILPTPAVPTVAVTAPTCAAAATNILSTYSASLTYNSTPAGLTVGAGGVITGGTTGTSYTITATNASNCSATTASFIFDGGAILPTPAVPTVAVTAPTCASAATNILSTYSASLTYTSTPAGLSVDASGVITGGTTGTSYTITASNGSLCSATTASFIFDGGAILPTPAVPTVVVTAPTCASAATNILSTYSASLTYTSTPAGLSVDAGGVITGGTNGTSYTITATNASLCVATTASFIYNGGAILPTPAVPTVAVTAPTCAAAATNILSTYSASLTYNSTPAGLTVGAGGVITGGTTGTSYTITATNASNCSATTASFIFDGGAILPTPAVPTVAVTAPTCASAATNILSTYSASLTYTSTPAGLSVDASGVITGGTNGTSYTITATNASLCAATTASFTFNAGAVLPTPMVFSVTGGGEVCIGGTGVPVGLSNSNVGINYQLQLNGVNNGAAISGTGSAISFGNKTGVGTYTVIATNATTTCTASMTGSVNITFCLLGSIESSVWYDANGDGAQGAGENGLAGATVTLDPGTPGNPADDVTTTTDALGNYLFSNLPAGNYTVSVNVATVTAGLPAGVTASELAQTYDADGTGTANKSTIALAAGENNTDQDFGYRASAGSIGAIVWYDTNGDGIKGAGENGLAGATVTLDPGTPGNPADDITTTTDASGNYLFSNLPAGNYTVSVNYATVTAGLPAGVLASQLSQTYDADGTSTANNSTVALVAAGTSTNQNFGYRAVGSIGDLVWYDTNGDGLKDVGENGLAGATVTLDPSTPGNPADDIITITDASGNYLFSNLVFGTYIISVNVATVTAGIPSGYNSSQLVPTFDADSSVGTPLKSTIVLSFGQNNLDQDFAFVKSSDATTGGHGGGVESESLGDAISKIYVGRKKNSEPTEFVKSSKNLFNKSKYKTLEAYKGNGQTMLDMFPKELVAGNIANETSPKDILDYTIADQVLAVDFSVGGKTKAVVLGIKTSNKVYNHTKASCDRLRGAEILNIQKVKLQGYNFLMQGIKQRNGVVEYAVSFAVAKNNNDTNYSIQTNWYVNAYKKFNDVYNFQVWSTRPADTQKLVSDILNNLKSYMPVNQTEVQKFPETYASKVYREKGELIVKLRSTKVGNTAEITMEELYSETANNIKFRDNTLSTQIKQELRVDIADGYEYDGVIKVDSKVEDAFYHADGNWGLDFDKRYTKINNYFIWNNFNRKYSNEEYSIDRNVEIKATSEYDYLTVYKTLLPGTLSADYSEYKYLAFTAKGSGMTEIGLIKSSIEDWKSQYRIMVNLTEKEQTYYIPFDAFISATSKESMTPNDLTTLMFTFLPVEAKTKELDMMISNLKFVKAAGKDGVVISKVVKFDNSFLAYPNPSKGKVNLMLFSNKDTNADIILSDLLGRTIHKSSADLKVGRNEFDFNFNIPSGTYILNVTSKDTDYGTSKIIFR